MKNYFLSLTIFSYLLLSGCQPDKSNEATLDFDSCTDFQSNRVKSPEVQIAGESDYLLSSIYRLPVFVADKGYFAMIDTLEKIEEPYKVKVVCLERGVLHFTIESDFQSIKGFYLISELKYFSGPFSEPKIEVVIQADADSKAFKALKKQDSTNQKESN